MRRSWWFLAVAVCTGLASGCVEQRYTVISDPPGARVLRNGQDIGTAPADDYFVYYGTYHFTLIKDGYETLQVDQEIKPPWYEYWPLDFVSEVLVPVHIEDVREFRYQMTPLQQPNIQQLLGEAQNVRNRGKLLQPPSPPPPNTPPPRGLPVAQPAP
jgi:hypothetical protein